jgi:Flp pilus assembly protein CpaB
MELAQRLVSTRKGTILISAVAAVLAGVMILVYVERYRNTVNAGGTPVTVLVAGQAIAKGTAGSVIAAKGLYTAMTIRQSQLLEGALSDPSSLRGKVATHDIYVGAQLTASDFAAGETNLASSLTDRERLISIPLDSAHGLTGQLQAGDSVDVYAGFNVIPLAADGTPLSGGQARPVLRLVMSDIPVVNVGSKGGGLGGSSTANVDLKVDAQQAAELAFASDNGKIWLALRPSAGASAARPSIVTIETLLLGVPPVTALHSFGVRR